MLDLAWLNRFLCIIGYKAKNFCLEFFNQLGSYTQDFTLPSITSRNLWVVNYLVLQRPWGAPPPPPPPPRTSPLHPRVSLTLKKGRLHDTWLSTGFLYLDAGQWSYTTIFSNIKEDSSAFKMANFQSPGALLQSHRQIIEEDGTATQHGDTLEKRDISVDDLLNPSRENHSKKIKYFNRVSFCLGRSTTAVRAILFWDQIW